MYRVLEILTDAEVEECRKIAAAATFTDGRISNPHNQAKVNEQLHDTNAYEKSVRLLHGALVRSEELHRFGFPVLIAPPLLSRYKQGMNMGRIPRWPISRLGR